MERKSSLLDMTRKFQSKFTVADPRNLTLEFACASAEDRRFRVEIDGRDAGEVRVPATSDVFETFALDVTLSVGLHSIRLSNPSDWMPDVDRMVLR